MTYGYEDDIDRAWLTTGRPQEEGEEYAAYHPGAGNEAHVEDVGLVQPLGEKESGGENATTTRSSSVRCKTGVQGSCGTERSGGEASVEPAPEVRCGGNVANEDVLDADSRLAHREYVNADQCPAQKSYPRGRRWHVQVMHQKPGGVRSGRVNIGASIGACIVGGTVGGLAAAFSSAGLATEAGAYAGCFVAGGIVTVFEVL